MFENLVGKLGNAFKMVTGAPLTYDETKELAQSENAKDRLSLARRSDVRPEVLYFLAEDNDLDVRRHIAQNPATPLQADVLLARDDDADVRVNVAQKVSRAIPNLGEDKQSKLGDLALEVLEILVTDQLPRVRAMIAEELKETPNAPKTIIDKLAFDQDLSVAGPILKFSPLLSEEDLLRLIATAPADGALSFIAQRNQVVASISDALVSSRDVRAVAELLKNPGAQIREDSLDRIVSMADDIETWHEPLVLRSEVPPHMVKRIAGFVATSLLNILAERKDLDSQTAHELSLTLKRRINEEGSSKTEEEIPIVEPKAEEMDEDQIVDAIEMGNKKLVTRALAYRSSLGEATVVKILKSLNPRAVVALCWKSELSMRTALRVQRRIANIPGRQIINARGGTDYPLGEEDMSLLLEMF